MMSEDSSAAGTDNRPPMLEENDYETRPNSQDVPTEASPDPPSAIPPSAAYMLNTLSELTTQVEGHPRLEHNKVKLENDQVILARNKQNAELKQETESLKTTLRNKEATIAHLTCETKTVLSKKKTLEDKYLEEIVCLKSANQVATDHFNSTKGTVPREQACYWLSATAIASLTSDPPKHVTPFVRTSPAKSQVQDQLCIAKDICSIVLASVNVVPPISDCMCAELRSSCDREHNRCSDTSSASNAIFEINKLRDQLQGKDATIMILDAQININAQVLNVELSKSNAYSRSTFTAKINALTAENAKLKTELSGKKCSGSIASEKPKVLASGMYTNSSKTSNRPTQKPPVQQNKKPNVPVNLSTRTKPATESRKPMPKSHTQNHRILPSKSVNARRAADHNRKLNVLGDQLERLLVVLSLSGNPLDDISRCPRLKLSDRKAGSKGISGFQGQPVADSIADKIETTTTYGKFKRAFLRCSIYTVIIGPHGLEVTEHLRAQSSTDLKMAKLYSQCSVLGAAYPEQDTPQSAAQMFAMAKDIMDTTLGPYHVDSIEACQNLSKSSNAMKRIRLLKLGEDMDQVHKMNSKKPNAFFTN
ncbi:hypothetical protein Tco_0686199 [Tanacetum coccineum]